ncbi:hypothetical protein BJF78_14010 [Pseudonocardia sp. CNS-139]|nr:hypothetical protein BJF78_14010 [Pseudonocardia sp. CNS-139]
MRAVSGSDLQHPVPVTHVEVLPPTGPGGKGGVHAREVDDHGQPSGAAAVALIHGRRQGILASLFSGLRGRRGHGWARSSPSW